jgi:tetratricopeptide (TPR) repeat protein
MVVKSILKSEAIKQVKAILCILISLASLFMGFPATFARAGETCDEWVAKVVSVQGVVQTRKAGEAEWVPVNLNDTYCPGDIIRVLELSRAAVVLPNESTLRLDQNTTITFVEPEKEQPLLLKLLSGAAHFLSRIPRALKVATPFVNGAVEGTEFLVRVAREQTFLSVFEGKVTASNEAGSLLLASGQSAVALKGQAPALHVVVRPRDAVQWALYYSPIIYYPPGEAPRDTRDARLYVYRASQLLAVGRYDEAETEIDRALSLQPNYSDAFALQAIIAVVQNERDKALSAAQQAVEADPNSATAQIALSYAHQARFDLEGARTSLEKAVQLDPENALAWARLAELQASFGYLSRSLESAEKAVALDPNLSRTQTVLGFAYLNKVKIGKSKEAFQKAIELDQADPLPRLGLGLAKIRGSDLEEGRAEIEIAASLDPNNSLIRSYLGKAYYEEKRTDLDGPQYEIAKKLDPKDPTPYFYDAIRKQTINRPVEALRDFQKSIELNDNRAVFRSRQKLDSDLAARSSSLARIYSDLGFQELALVEGWKSVNTDPTNHSAHRFLADSYSARPRHEIARVSELLQSQLLQPNNITPIQPRLAESNLFLISSGGAADLSFNEFNPIFNRDRIAMQASGLVSENETYAGEVVASGIYKKASFSVGYTHFETDGWRDNADQDDDIVNAFFQYELTYKTSIQAEFKYRDLENGDLQLRFFEDDFLENLDEDEETKTFRLGFRHSFTPNSTLIANFQYQDADEDQDVQPTPSFPVIFVDVDTELDSDAYNGELSFLHRSNYINLVAGGGYADIDAEQKTTVSTTLLVPVPNPLPPPPFLLVPVSPPPTETTPDRDVEHANGYLYTYIEPVKSLTITVGGSYDDLDTDNDATKDRDQFNPKFGITWNPLPNTTIRGAAFRVLKRTLITDQTLEPTQVAGFNQFFDELNATDSWRYGGAVDQKFTDSLYGGAEYTYRNLSVPFNPSLTSLETYKWEEKIFRAYLFFTPNDYLALRAESLWERYERDQDFADGARIVETIHFPLGFSFFHPSGLSASLTSTYIDQQGSYERQGSPGTFENDNDQFWLIDAAIKYRFPKRYGFFTIGAKNLMDENFEYFETDRDNPRIQPDRHFFASITLAVP